MRIPCVYTFDNIGCGPQYTVKALERLGHTTFRMTEDDYINSNPDDYDLYWCQDSSNGIDFRRASSKHLARTSMWYWDGWINYLQRAPIADDDMAKVVADGGGWVFHAWQTDVERCNLRMGVTRQSWLPIAGDPYLWLDEPKEEKIYKSSIVGNCYDPGRGNVLNQRDSFGVYWPGPVTAFFQDAAKIYRQSWSVFHVPTFFRMPQNSGADRVDLLCGTTMRHYEAMCCGVPIVTTRKADFEKLGFRENFHYFVWEEITDILPAVEKAKKMAQDGGDEYSKQLRHLILDNHTYEHRLNHAFTILRENGVLGI